MGHAHFHLETKTDTVLDYDIVLGDLVQCVHSFTRGDETTHIRPLTGT